ncbi:MAG: hypothetical protein KAJ33_02385 [Thermoplasmata archaeon]|nr:hypothetical protein [Thermoplasmata archaeon]
MKVGMKILIIFLIIFSLLAIFFILPPTDYSEGELQLLMICDTNSININESFNVTYVLTNVGNTTVRLIDMSQGMGIATVVMDSNYTEIHDPTWYQGICLYNKEHLVKLEPGSNLSVTYSIQPSYSYINSTGDYYFKGVFRTVGAYSDDSGSYWGEDPFWGREVESNFVKILVNVPN